MRKLETSIFNSELYTSFNSFKNNFNPEIALNYSFLDTKKQPSSLLKNIEHFNTKIYEQFFKTYNDFKTDFKKQYEETVKEVKIQAKNLGWQLLYNGINPNLEPHSLLEKRLTFETIIKKEQYLKILKYYKNKGFEYFEDSPRMYILENSKIDTRIKIQHPNKSVHDQIEPEKYIIEEKTKMQTSIKLKHNPLELLINMKDL